MFHVRSRVRKVKTTNILNLSAMSENLLLLLRSNRRDKLKSPGFPVHANTKAKFSKYHHPGRSFPKALSMGTSDTECGHVAKLRRESCVKYM